MDMQQVRKNKTMKIDGCSEIYKNVYHNDSYLLLIGKTQWQSLEISNE